MYIGVLFFVDCGNFILDIFVNFICLSAYAVSSDSAFTLIPHIGFVLFNLFHRYHYIREKRKNYLY
jgi:hypothetical protein